MQNSDLAVRLNIQATNVEHDGHLNAARYMRVAADILASGAVTSSDLAPSTSSDPEGGARGVQTSIATKQESRPESAPRTETATVTALRECQRVLAMMIDPESIKSTSVIHAFAAATEAEAKARTVLNGVAKSDGGAT